MRSRADHVVQQAGPLRSGPRIRIMHVVHGLATGGTEQGVRKLLDGLDHDVFEQVVCTVVAEAAALPTNGRVVCLGRSGKAGFLVPDLIRIFRRERPHIVHSRNWGTMEAVAAARLSGIPAVIHSEHGRDLQTMGHQPWRRRVFRRLCYAWADRIFAVSQELRDFYSTQVGLGPSGFQVIPNGVDTQQFRPDPDWRRQLREKLGVGPETLVVGAVSRLDPVKDHRTLFKAAELAASWGIKLYLVIVGDGIERTMLERDLAARRGLAGRTLFAGNVSNVEEWLNSFDVFVLPSLSEGMSNTLLEAMAVGIPPIVTRVGGNPEVIEEERSGMFFEPGDCRTLATHLKRMAEDPEGRRQLGQTCRQRVLKHFGLPRMMQAYSEMYNEVLKQHGRTEPAFSRA